MRVEVNVFKTNPIIIRVGKQFDLFVLPVEDCKPDDWKSSEGGVVSVVEENIVNCGTWEEIEEAEDPNRDN